MNASLTKVYTDIPFGHRQPTHDGHCRWVHGHNWSFKLRFTATSRDTNNFIVDFGKLGVIKEYFANEYDHALLISESDPQLPFFRDMESRDLAKLRVLKDCSAEGLAKQVLEDTHSLIQAETDKRVSVVSVVVDEDSKNSASYSRGTNHE